MQALLQNTDPPQPGYAQLVLSQIKSPGLPGDAGIIVQRAADRQFLGRDGWQDSQLTLSPLMARFDADELWLKIGPEIVDNLKEQENYRLYLSWPNQPLQLAAFTALDVNYSSMKRRKDEIDLIQAREQHYTDDGQEASSADPASSMPPPVPPVLPTPPQFPEQTEYAPLGQDETQTRQPAPPQAGDRPQNRQPEQYQTQAADYNEDEKEQHTPGSVLSSAIVLIGVMFLIVILMYFFL